MFSKKYVSDLTPRLSYMFIVAGKWVLTLTTSERSNNWDQDAGLHCVTLPVDTFTYQISGPLKLSGICGIKWLKLYHVERSLLTVNVKAPLSSTYNWLDRVQVQECMIFMHHFGEYLSQKTQIIFFTKTNESPGLLKLRSNSCWYHCTGSLS